MDENKELDLALDLEIPTLESELATMDEMSVVPAQETQVTNSFLKEENLTEAEAKAVADLSEKIDISNSKIVLYYGTSCQKEIASFSDIFTILEEHKEGDKVKLSFFRQNENKDYEIQITLQADEG